MRFADADREAIRRAGELFVQNARATPRNDRATAACYEDGAILLAPGRQPVIGRTAIERFLSSFPPLSEYRLEVAEIFGDGDLAFERGAASMTLRPAEKAPEDLRMNYVVVWRRQPDASWLVAREILTPA